jgi:hypothetical protein
MDEKGFEVAGFRKRRICVSPQRNPEKNAADRMRMKPMVENATSPATIMRTPNVMVRMMRISFQEGVSRRKRKAKRRTNMRVEDLVIAVIIVSLYIISKSDAEESGEKGKGRE